MKFICIYTDLNNPANKTKANIEADELELYPPENEEGSSLIALIKHLKNGQKLEVFIVQEYRIVELYASDFVQVEDVPKNKPIKNIHNGGNLVSLSKKE